MNVVVVNDYAYVNGGASRVALLSALSLAQRGVGVTFFAGVGPASDDLKQSAINVRVLDRASYSDRGAIFAGLWGRDAKGALDGGRCKLPRSETIVRGHAH